MVPGIPHGFFWWAGQEVGIGGSGWEGSVFTGLSSHFSFGTLKVIPKCKQLDYMSRKGKWTINVDFTKNSSDTITGSLFSVQIYWDWSKHQVNLALWLALVSDGIILFWEYPYFAVGSHGFIFSEESVSFVSVTLFEVAFKGKEAFEKMNENQWLI